ncbi:MAG: hypothetical protein IJ808_04670 [Muribaculaceae bacterium]|nr:hypothetical protein [Muribaculaceae bacterium]
MKKILILIALLVGFQSQADAQFFKKLGNAIDKAAKTIDSVSKSNQKTTKQQSSQSQASSGGKQIGESLKTENGTLTLHGDNPGMNINWMGLYRIWGNTTVSAYFQLINQAELKLSVDLIYPQNYMLDNMGRQYTDDVAKAGNRTVGPYSIEPGAKALYSFHYPDVPASVKQMQLVYLGVISYIGEQGGSCEYSFRIQDAPIKILPALTASGVFGDQQVKLGQTISSLPQSFPGVYDKYVVTDDNDEGEVTKLVTFYLNGEETMSAVSNDLKTLNSIIISSRTVYFKVGKNYYRLGDKVSYDDVSKCERIGDYQTLSYKEVFFNDDKDDVGYTIINNAYINE